MPVVAGVDSSTQSTKVELRDVESGAVTARAAATHPATTPPRSEQDPESWWRALVEAFGSLGPDRADVVAVSVAGQQHGLVVLDDSDEVIRPAKLWNDTESATEAARLVAELGAEAWVEACGLVPVASFTITKLAWLAAHEPENLERVRRVMLPHDYLTWRLTGEHVTDRGDASGTGWWDPVSGRYRPDLLALVDPAPDWLERLPRIVGPADAAGRLTTGAAEMLGLAAGIPVGPGSGDNMAAALGLGLGAGDLAMSLGTSGTVYAASVEPARDPSGLVAGFAGADGGFLPLVATLNATKVTDSIARWLGRDRDRFAADALGAPSGANGVTVVPYFDGERTPNLPGASGWVHGLRHGTTPGDLARAAHEGVACGLLAGVDALAAVGIDTSGALHLTGGGSRSAAFPPIVAELHGRPLVVPDADETVATGACVQAAGVAGHGTLHDVAERWSLGAGRTIEPAGDSGPGIRSTYDELARVVAAHERG